MSAGAGAQHALRVVVLASGRGTNLSALLGAIDEHRCQAEVVAVVSDKAGAAALDLARKRGIATHCLPFRRQDRARWDADLADRVAEAAPELVVLAGFMRLLGPAFLERFAGRVVNVHPSLLPAFPGLAAPAQTLAAGVHVAGCTVHLVDAGVDSGAILAQAAVPVLPGDDEAALHERIQREEHALLPGVVDAIARGALSLAPSGPRWVAAPIAAGALRSPALGAR
ncbi:MAG: phosphoribosylglycinamide formyltransferase [Myxococcota bacterium]